MIKMTFLSAFCAAFGLGAAIGVDYQAYVQLGAVGFLCWALLKQSEKTQRIAEDRNAEREERMAAALDARDKALAEMLTESNEVKRDVAEALRDLKDEIRRAKRHVD